MDFVVSKVALSICALLVAAVLGEVCGSDAFRDVQGELEGIAMDLVEAASGPLDARTECVMPWHVPSLSSGEQVSVELRVRSVRAFAGACSAAATSPFPIHTWTWDGSVLNESKVQALDACSSPAVSAPGGVIVLTAAEVPVGNGFVLMLFARAGG